MKLCLSFGKSIILGRRYIKYEGFGVKVSFGLFEGSKENFFVKLEF